MKVLVTGAAGFICGYLVEELLNAGHEVIGVDNYEKYGVVQKAYTGHPKFRMVEGDARDTEFLKSLSVDCDQIVAAAAKIGGISYFHMLPYDLLAENERILAATFDAAIWAHREKSLRRIIVVSSSMVFENATRFPSKEGDERTCPPPSSTYGFQKLSSEYFAKGAQLQYGLPYTIVRPFNCVGLGEKRAKVAKDIYSGNVKLAMSHVVPDLIHKALLEQSPLHLLGDGEQVRHFTYGGDLARGIRLAMESDKAVNEDFNLSTPVATRVRDLAEMIWRKIHGDRPLEFAFDKPFEHDVRLRVPDITKAKTVLGFEAQTPLNQMLDELIPWIKTQMAQGGL